MRYKPGGRTGASAPTEALQGVQWAGDRKGRPYGGLQEGAVRRADVGIGPYGTACRDGRLYGIILALFT
ncbi:hypothetical protein MM35RIKEN_18380 (plasmid) [Vescimonas fastidiosa]|uniref:Uncharacterized protein n=1 Tax=Vescimonas fastidiosa TaxID=2714353 RepID=A0A810Q1C3_9FIRM|nr:hypothetical protein MM35RIKEN_18380 [Vescimonas fastidiosa]